MSGQRAIRNMAASLANCYHLPFETALRICTEGMTELIREKPGSELDESAAYLLNLLERRAEETGGKKAG